MANQFLALSLFLMLLSFFIVMNAISGFDETKKNPVMESISLTFAYKDPEKENNDPSPDPTTRLVVNQGDTLTNIEGLFSANIANFQATKNRLGTIMHVRLPLNSFEYQINMPQIMKDDGDVIENAEGKFLITMVTLLRGAQNKMPYRMDMALSVPSAPQDFMRNNPDEYAKQIKKLSEISQTLERSGMPVKLMSAGIEEGDEGYIDLYFYPYRPYFVQSLKEKEGQSDL